MVLPSPSLGAVLRGLRSRNSWTLKQMSDKTGIPVSTLSKVEHDRLTLTYDKLYQLSRSMGMQMSELFADNVDDVDQQITARRSMGDLHHAMRVKTPNYDYNYLCTELRRKRMIPVITKIRAKTLEQFGAMVQHAGEEYVYVLKGQVVVNTEFYDPVTLEEGQSIYIDSSMRHAYLAGDGCDEAEVLGVMSSADEELMQSLMTIHEERSRPVVRSRAHAKGRTQPRQARAAGV